MPTVKTEECLLHVSTSEKSVSDLIPPAEWANTWLLKNSMCIKFLITGTYADGAWVETFSIGYYGIWGGHGFIDASDIALILGAGPVGISATMVAATAGAKTIVIDPLPKRRELAMKYGADLCLDPTAGPIAEQVMDVTNGHGGDVCVEASGNDNAIASLLISQLTVQE